MTLFAILTCKSFCWFHPSSRMMHLSAIVTAMHFYVTVLGGSFLCQLQVFLGLDKIGEEKLSFVRFAEGGSGVWRLISQGNVSHSVKKKQHIIMWQCKGSFAFLFVCACCWACTPAIACWLVCLLCSKHVNRQHAITKFVTFWHNCNQLEPAAPWSH